MSNRALIAVLLSSVVATAGLAAAEPGGSFRAGAHAIDITPERLPIVVSGGFLESRADRVQDRLHARCLVLDDGSMRLAIAIVDTLMMDRETIDEIREAAAALTGIPPEHQLVAATHTHSAPSVMPALGTGHDEEYRRLLVRRVAAGIELAERNLEPARLGHAVVRVPEHTHCRRWIYRPDRMATDPFGRKSVRAHMHPGYESPDHVGPAGPVDDDLSVVSVRAADGRPIALLANYSQHYVGAPPLSADYFGVFADETSRRLEAGGGRPPFVGMLSQGTAGDQHWMDYASARKEGADRFTIGKALAALAVDLASRAEHRDAIRLGARETSVDLAVRSPDAGLLEWARPIAASVGDRVPANLQEVYALEQMALAARPRRQVRVQAMRIGDLGLVGLANEVFGITGLRIKSASPLGMTLNLELAGGADGYIPPPEQHALGGYTTWPARTACLEVDAEPKIVEAAVGMLEELAGKPRRGLRTLMGPHAASILNSEPLAYWRLGELGGLRALDSSGRSNHAALEVGVLPFLEGPDRAGFPGEWRGNRCIHFAGGRARAEIDLAGDDFSAELWVWNGLPADARAVTGTILSRGAPGGEEILAIGGLDPPASRSRLVFGVAGAGVAPLAGKTEIPPRAWRHVVLVRAGARVAVWLDGRLEIEGTVGPVSPPGGSTARQTIFLGGRRDGLFGLEGRVDEVAIHGRALPPEEVRRHLESAGT